MSGAICGTCHYASTGNVEPTCARADCPNKQTTFLPFKAENLKRAFAENDIPWPSIPGEFQERLSELVDEFLKAGIDPEKLRTVMRQEIYGDLVERQKELGANP